MFSKETNGEKLNQKELFLLKQKGKRRVKRVIWKGGDSTGKGAVRMEVTEYESRHLSDLSKKPKKKKRKSRRRKRQPATQKLVNQLYNS